MRRLAGQGGRALFILLHATLTVVLGLAVVGTVAVAALAWRLSQGPIDLDWPARRLEAMVNAEHGPTRLHIGSAALAWEGWQGGFDRPLDLRLTGLAATDANGVQVARIPRAELSLSFGRLLFGRIVPRAIEIDGAHIRIVRAADGQISLDLGGVPPGQGGAAPAGGSPFNALLAELTRPRQSDSAGAGGPSPLWSQFRRLRIGDADIVVTDRQFDTVWRAPQADLDLRRHRHGGVDGHADITLALGEQAVRLTAEATLAADGSGSTVQTRFSPIEPAGLARTVPALARLEALDAPVQGTLHLDLGPRLGWRHAALQAEIGRGVVRIGKDGLPILAATLNLEADPDHAALRLLRLVLAGRNGAGPVLQARGEAHRQDGHLAGTLQADLDQVPFADLGRYWPAGIAIWPREWVTRNVTAGTARAAHVVLAMQAAADGSDIELSAASGHASGDDLTVTWLRPVPPLEHVKAELELLSPDALVITTEGGREAGTTEAGIVAEKGSVKVTGLSQKDQFGAIRVDLAGSVADTLALLRHPRLRLLDRHPLDLRDPSGQVTANLGVNLPLDARTTMDAIAIHATGQLSALHLGAVVAGQDLNNGQLDLDVTDDGLRLEGSAELATIPAKLAVEMDFRAGPPNQVLRRYTVSATASTRQLAKATVDPGRAASGTVSGQVTLIERRSGAGEAGIEADLRNVALFVQPLGWRKPSGASANGSARILLDHDRIVAVDHVDVEGDAISVHGAADYADGKPNLLRLDRVVLGETRAAGQVHLAAAAGEPIRATLGGSSLDLSGRFAHHTPAAAKPASPAEDEPGTSWVADLKFDKVMLGEGRLLSDVSAHAEDDGQVLRQARLEGRAGRADRFALSIAPEGSRLRRLTGHADDAGALLRAFNILDTMEGGSLALSGVYDDRAPDHPLIGRAEISSFRLRDAPAATRILQAMTLYGLVSALRGPGLGFSRLIAPFRLADDTLQLDGARAFSASLGFTAKGRIDLARRVADVQGTIVPAYFFNSLLGHIPLLGRLFSPEKGGGVFAATYSVKGRLDDPAVTVNPLAALTPGFLRGLFGVFEGVPSAP